MTLDAAIGLYQAGDRAAAKAAALAVARSDPGYGGARNLLAAIAQEEGRQADAEAFAREALAVAPGDPIFLNTLGNGLLAQGRSGEAVAAIASAHQADPRQPDILFNLANAQRQAGQFDAAVESYRSVIALRPGHIGAYNNLAILLKAMGDSEAAAAVLIEAVAHAPGAAELRFNFGNALLAAGRAEAAAEAYRKAIALAPTHAEAHANLGAALAESGKPAEAKACFEKAIALDPSLTPAYVGLAGLVEEGAKDAVAHRRAVLALNPNLAAVRSSLLMCLHYTVIGRADLFTEHLAFGRFHDRAGAPTYSNVHDFAPERRLRVGFVSGDFRFHAMLFLVLPVLEARDPAQFELFCYSTTARPDTDTQRFRAAADHWRDVRDLSTDDLSALIIRDRIDILVDLSGHAPGNRLLVFAMRPAPVQLAWGDYVNTRGLAAMDVLLGDPSHTPAPDDALYVEQVARFSSDYVCYRPPVYAPPVVTGPAAANGYVTFGTFSEHTKIGPAAIAQWAAVLKAVPTAKFLLNGYFFTDAAKRGEITALFGREGVTADRLMFSVGGAHADFLGQYADVDIILDTTPYSGGLTTCEALLMGVPVLTIAGDRFCGRHAATHLINGGYPHGIADSLQDLVAKAKALAADPQRLGAQRLGIHTRFLISPLCDVRRCAGDFYAALRLAWRGACVRFSSPPSSR